MKFKISLIVLSTISLFSLQAQTCCSGGIPLSNNIGLSILEKGTFQVGLNYDYNNLNTLNIGEDKIDDNSRLRITHAVLLNIGYSITDNLSVEGLLTWVNQRRKISQFGNENLDQTNGIGDAVFLVKYRFENVLGQNSSVNIGLGTKIPLGSSTETNTDGIILNSDLQPGSNAWDIIYWSMLSKNLNFRPTLNVFSRIIYRSTGTNSSYLETTSYTFGDEFQVFVGLSDQFFIFKTLANPSISFKYRKADQDRIEDFHLQNTGGNWVFFIPNLSIDITPKLAFSTKAEIPIYSRVDGTQLTPTFRLTTGILYKFSLKKTINPLN